MGAKEDLFNQLLRAGAPVPTPFTGRSTRVNTGASEYLFENAPDPSEVHVVAAGLGSVHVRLFIGQSPPATIHLDLHPDVEKVFLISLVRKPVATLLAVDLRGRKTIVVIEGDVTQRVRLENGNARLAGRGKLVSLELCNAHLEITGVSPLRELRVRGVSSLRPDEDMAFNRTFIEPNAVLRSTREVGLGIVRFDSQAPADSTCQLKGPFTALRFPDKSHLHLVGGRVRLSPSRLRDSVGPIHGWRVTGEGEIILDGILERPVFAPAKTGRIRLRLEQASQVLDARGEVSLDATRASVCSGDPRHPLVIAGVKGAEGAHILDVDIYSLEIHDLNGLKEAERLSPWLPRGRAGKRRQDNMKLGGGSIEEVARKRAHFWTRLATIVEGTHAPGRIQSEVRFASARARRRGSAQGREKKVLQLYAVVGYGERIGSPLLLLLALSAAAALAHEDVSSLQIGSLADVATFGGNLVAYFLSPLKILRIDGLPSPPHVSDDWPQIGAALVRALGFVLIGFSLLAIRRVAKTD